jgi:hypothetical protein
MRGKSTLLLVVCSLFLITAPARAGALEVRQEIARIAAEMFIAGQYDRHKTRQLITLI